MTTSKRPKLTQEFAYKATTEKTKERFPDHNVVGLNLRVMKSGAKAWVILYRKGDRSSGEMKIGSVDTMTLKMARDVARQKLAEVATGADPIEDKRSQVAEAQAKSASTLTAVSEKYRASEKYLTLRPSTQAAYNNSLDKHILPALGKRPIESIKRGDVAAFLDDLALSKGGNVANHAQSAFSVVMAFAARRGVVDFNPVQGARVKSKTPRKDRPLDEDTLKGLWGALDAHEGVTPLVANMLRLLLFLPARANEMTGMKWEEVDLEAGLWTIPGDRMKGHEGHELPLGEYAAGLLTKLKEEQQQEEGSPVSLWVFPNKAGTGAMNRTIPTKATARIVERRGLTKFSPHDFRHTCATWLAGEIPSEIIERVLSHKVGAGKAIEHYIHHEYIDEKRNALAAWEQELLRIVEGVAVPSSSNRQRSQTEVDQTA